ncbi:CotH kinase family protein [Saccharicrinis sp. FJH54]|uniref:CotH kinase family protein n=1 Tax=Saccharicrinis sp. FJH54 TaxID=3344665 RepID=UPI0035D51A7E
MSSIFSLKLNLTHNIIKLAFFIVMQAFLIPTFSQSHWEMIIDANGTWKYYVATETNLPDKDWYNYDYNDTSWEVGYGGIGFGDGDDSTIIPQCHSLYLRKDFFVSNKNNIKKLFLDIDYDDAFVFYLNGKEISRSSNLKDSIPNYNTPLENDHEANMYMGYLPERHKFDDLVLYDGKNTIAVQILNSSQSSSDLTSIIYLHGEIISDNIIYSGCADWFTTPIPFTYSNLPIFLINTHNNVITNEPKVYATLRVINYSNEINNIDSSPNEYSGSIGIEYRGSSSMLYDKKNYSIETRDEHGNNLNVSLLGLPEENDWVLHGPYADKSLIRNALAYYLGNLTDRWNPHTKFIELVINENYMGVYLLTEKIKISNNRLNLHSLNNYDVLPQDISGGFLLKIDRGDYFWNSPFVSNPADTNKIKINFVEPDKKSINKNQINYIKKYVTDFESSLYKSVNGSGDYKKYIDVLSFVDFFIVNELCKNVDAYRLSSYMYKDKNKKLVMGPLWDFNFSLGNANFNTGESAEGWIYNSVSKKEINQVPFWWDKFRQDPYFNKLLKRRWSELRKSEFAINNIYNYIDSLVNILQEPARRNFSHFDVINRNIWPNYYIGKNYNDEIEYLKTWLADRIHWIDGELNKIEDLDTLDIKDYKLFVYPNPTNKGVIYVDISVYTERDLKFKLFNSEGQLVYTEKQVFKQGNTIHIIPGETRLNKGVYVLTIEVDKIDKIFKTIIIY